MLKSPLERNHITTRFILEMINDTFPGNSISKKTYSNEHY